MKIKFKMLLLKIAIALIALYTAINLVKPYIHNQQEPVRIIKQHEVKNASYTIISEGIILGKLNSNPKIESFEQPFSEKRNIEDDVFLLGKRQTAFNISGNYSAKIELDKIKINHIDQENGIVYISMPKTYLKVYIPYNGVSTDKVKGIARLDMKEDTKKYFVEDFRSTYEKKLNNDKNVMKQAKLFNQDAVKDIVMQIDGVKTIVFY